MTALLAAADRIARATARRQLVALERATSGRPAGQQAKPTRWAHVPITALFERAGNRLFPRSNGSFDSGHEPVHGSKSGRCVLIDPARGRWWCRACRRGGDAVAAVMSLHGWTYPHAVRWLTEQYGPPAGAGGGQKPAQRPYPHRPAWREVCL